jgi:putative hemolysin
VVITERLASFRQANRVNHPSEYPWSSSPYNGTADTGNRITEHDVYGRLGRLRSVRAYRYRTLFTTALDQKAIHAMRTAASFSMPRGNNRFKAALGRHIGQAKRSRPLCCLQDYKVDAKDVHLSPLCPIHTARAAPKPHLLAP